MNLWRYFLFGCGQVGIMVLARYFFQWILVFADVGGGKGPDGATIALFTAAVVGTVFLGFRLFDGVTDPLAGMLSDYWVRKGKERRTLLWFAILLPPIGVILTFAPNVGMGTTLRWAVLAAGMFVFFVGYTFYAIPYWSLIDDYAGEHADQRRVLSNLLGAGILVATAVGFVATPDMVESLGFLGASVALAIPATILMALPYWAQPAAGPAVKQAEGPQESPLKGFVAAFKHRRFVAVLLIFSGSQMSFTVMTSAAFYIVKYLLESETPKGDVKFVLGPFLLVAIPFFVAVPWISRKLGWQKAVVVASIALAFVYAGTAFLGQPVIHSKMVTAGLLFGLGGPMAAVLLGLEAEAITACAREQGGEVTSVYFGVYNFIVKAMNGLAVTLTGLLITASKTPEYGLTAVRAMGLMAGGMLVVGCILYFLVNPRADQGKVAAPAE